VTSVAAVATDRIPFARTAIGPEAVDAVAEVLASGWLTTGPQVAEFEKEFSAGSGLSTLSRCRLAPLGSSYRFDLFASPPARRYSCRRSPFAAR